MIQFSTFVSQILPFTLKREGGYANVTGDRGGETYRGITRKNWPYWDGWVIIEWLKPLAHNQIVASLEQSVANFYYQNFFLAKGFQYLADTGTATALFDFAVNGGFSPMQFFTEFNKKFGKYIPVNSVVNAESLKLVNAAPQKEVQKMVLAIREQHYEKLIKINPSQEKFRKGWANRMGELYAHLGISKNNHVALVVLAVVVLLAIYLLFGNFWRIPL